MPIKKCDEIGEASLEAGQVELGDGTTTIESELPPATTRNRIPKVRENVHLGKTFQAVERTIYDDIVDDPNDLFGQFTEMLETNDVIGNGRIRQHRPRDIADPLRAEARKFFTGEYIGGRIEYVNSNLDGGFGGDEAYDYVYGESILKIEFLQGPQESQGTGDIFKRYSQNMKVSSDAFISNNEGVTDEQVLQGAFDEYVKGEGVDYGANLFRNGPLIDLNTDFTDHYTNISIPFSKPELQRYVNNVNNPQYADVEPNYNFFEPGYEGYIQGSAIELQLPNLYSKLTQEDSYPSMQYAIEYTAPLAYPHIGPLLGYVKGVQSMGSGQNTDIFQYIGFPSSKIRVLNEADLYDDTYPMNNTLVLQTDKNGALLEAAETAGMTDELTKFVMNETYGVVNGLVAPQTSDQSIVTGLTSELLFQTSEEKVVVTEGGEYDIDSERSERMLQITNFEQWLQHSYLDDSASYYEFPDLDSSSVMLGLPNSQTSNTCSTFLDTLRALVLTGKIQQIIDDKFRTFADMLEGKEAYNETIIYEIVKTPSYADAKAQRIFVPNTEELEILKYIDTQVKYGGSGVKYTYEVFAHQLIVGTKYSYTGPNGTNMYSIDKANRSVEFGVSYSPSLQIARLPIYSETEQILDHPPIFPNVDLIPYKDVPTKFLINLSSNIGEYKVQPIIINNRDKTFVQNYRASRKLLPDDPIMFKSDDPTKRYEIYRTVNPPRSYQDFAGKLLTQLSSDVATSVSYVDNVIPNQKYYYMFRSIDVHGNRSNPSDVYEVELVNFDGMTFFNTSIHKFQDTLRENNNISNSREFRRYLKINPNFIQSLFNYEKTFPVSQEPASQRARAHGRKAEAGESPSAYMANKVVLGQAEEPVWNKKFKVRVTSKNSGKKFDLNITCKVNYTKTTNSN